MVMISFHANGKAPCKEDLLMIPSLEETDMCWQVRGLPWWLSGKESTCQCRRCEWDRSLGENVSMHAWLGLDSLWSCGRKPPRLLCPWDFRDKNTGVNCQFLLQGIFPTQGSSPCLLHQQADSLPLSHLRSPYRGMDTCVCMAESLRYSPETITTFLICYTSTENKKLERNPYVILSIHQRSKRYFPGYDALSFNPR